MSPDDFNTIQYRLNRIEQNLEKVETQRIPELLAQGRSWSTSMLTSVANLERELRELDDRLLLRREADERFLDTRARLAQLEATAAQCMPKADAADQHRSLSEALLKLEARLNKMLDDHFDQHKAANAERATMWRWLIALTVTVILGLLSTGIAIVGILARFLPDGH